MTDMPWRLQLAMAAMQGEIARSYSALHLGSVDLYFRMADAMLAEHTRTAPGEESRAAKLEHIIDSMTLTPPIGFRDACQRRAAIEKLTRMLNESE